MNFIRWSQTQRSFGRLLTEKVSLIMCHANLKYEYAHVKFDRLLALFNYLFRIFMSFSVKDMMHNAHTMNSMKLLHSLPGTHGDAGSRLKLSDAIMHLFCSFLCPSPSM
jgi:hypothetical protein